MFTGLICTELLKYRRSPIPWLIGLGGLLPAGSALLTVINGETQVGWQLLAVRGMNYMDLLALLLTAVLTGYVFAGEYHESTADTLFTYPVPRYMVFISKFTVTAFFALCLYFTFAFSEALFGLTYIGAAPGPAFLKKSILLLVMLWAANLVLIPLTAFICILAKGIGAYLLTGMGYVIVYMSFMASDYSRFIPVCVPDNLVANYLTAECISKNDFTFIAIISALVFIIAFTAGAVYYSRYDVYK